MATGGAGIGISVILDDERVRTMLQRMADAGHDLRPTLKKVQVYMLQSIGRTFDAQGRPTRWAPLSPVTLALRRKGRGKGIQALGFGTPGAPGFTEFGVPSSAFGAKILQDTGRLRASVTAVAGGDAVRQVTATTMVIGTRVQYAAIHQVGRKAQPNVTLHVPAHRRRKHKRTQTQAWGRPIEAIVVDVRAHNVVAHTKTVTLPAIPARPFLQWLADDIRAATEIVAVDMEKAARGGI